MKFKVGDYIENIKYSPEIYLYGTIDKFYNSWIRTLILTNEMELVYYSFKERELKLLTDKDKINHFNKLLIFK